MFFPTAYNSPSSPKVFQFTQAALRCWLKFHWLHTNPWALILIILAYCIVVNHSPPGKYKSFHLSLSSPWIIAVTSPQKHSHGEYQEAHVKQTQLCLSMWYRDSVYWRSPGMERRGLPSSTEQTQWLIRPLQPPSGETLMGWNSNL